jgi:hypothetical protein
MDASSRSPCRSRSAVALAALAVAFACGGDDSARYDAVHDDRAMAAIASHWMAPEVDLSLCEDFERSAVEPGPDDCTVDHVVRGGGLGRTHEEEYEEGCGGCSPGAVAYVRGSASGPFGMDVAVSGRVVLGRTSSGDPYAFPYGVEVFCDETAEPCSIRGSIDEDGNFSATVVVGPVGPGHVETGHSLTRAGAATCP